MSRRLNTVFIERRQHVSFWSELVGFSPPSSHSQGCALWIHLSGSDCQSRVPLQYPEASEVEHSSQTVARAIVPSPSRAHGTEKYRKCLELNASSSSSLKGSLLWYQHYWRHPRYVFSTIFSLYWTVLVERRQESREKNSSAILPVTWSTISALFRWLFMNNHCSLDSITAQYLATYPKIDSLSMCTCKSAQWSKSSSSNHGQWGVRGWRRSFKQMWCKVVLSF